MNNFSVSVKGLEPIFCDFPDCFLRCRSQWREGHTSRWAEGEGPKPSSPLRAQRSNQRSNL